MTTDQHFERLIQVKGCYNLRDVGGYPTADGHTTRWRRLLRSANLSHIQPDDKPQFLTTGVRTIIDLRRTAELRNENYFFEDEMIDIRHIPIFDDQDYQLVDQQANTLEELYERLLDFCGKQFANVLRVIGDQQAAPVLVHCAVGKDRTGLSIALALSAAGVARETIADDYSLSNQLLSPLHEQFRAASRARGENQERHERMLESRRETILSALSHLDSRYGGVQGYFDAIGLNGEEIETLRNSLIE